MDFDSWPAGVQVLYSLATKTSVPERKQGIRQVLISPRYRLNLLTRKQLRQRSSEEIIGTALVGHRHRVFLTTSGSSKWPEGEVHHAATSCDSSNSVEATEDGLRGSVSDHFPTSALH